MIAQVYEMIVQVDFETRDGIDDYEPVLVVESEEDFQFRSEILKTME